MKSAKRTGVIVFLVSVFLGAALFGGTVATAAPSGIQLGDKIMFGAQMRWRSEMDGKDFVNSTAMNERTFLRTMLGVEATMIENVTVYAQIQDAREMGTNSANTGGDDNLGFHQGYIKLHDFISSDFYLQVGRFEAPYGRWRIMGLGDWGNRRSYDGGRFGYSGEKAKFDLLALKVIDRSFATPADHRDWVLYGCYGSFWNQHLDLFALYDWDQYEVDGNQALARWTIGTYMNWKAPSGWRVDFDAAYQTGTQYDKDLAAYMVAGELSYQFRNPQRTKFGFGLDVTSGDDGSDATTVKSFNNMYYSGHGYRGYMDIFKSTTILGLMDGFARFAFNPVTDLTTALDFHHFQNLEEYTAADGGTSTALGQEVDLTVKLNYRKGLGIRAGSSIFFASKDWKPDSDPAIWFYGMITADL
ncbi:alginate export family protein [bacterium]|nr:alginate export family protein [bacterium]